jgi:hypothetical protein
VSVIRCTHCGTTNRAGSNFCNRCGTDLRTPSDLHDTAAAPADHTPTAPDTANNTAAEESRPTDRIPTAPPSRTFGDTRSTTEPPPTTPLEADDERPRRLVGNLQGLLEPIRITGNWGNDEPKGANNLMLPTLTANAAQLRRIRDLVAEEPTLLEHQPPRSHARQVRLRLPWLITLLTLAIGLPLLLVMTAPVGTPRYGPGVAEAYAAIDALPPDSTVWLFWAYDPATAGEMDLVAQPLVSHLLEREVQSSVISLLPTGLATARRVWASAAPTLMIDEGVGILNGRTAFVEAAYLPGGAPALALLAAAPAEALQGFTMRAAQWQPLMSAQGPALMVVLAPHPEEVQQWLELIQPEVSRPVIAFTGAGAEPVLWPYLASGQLQGLVSGFDGGAAYQQLRDRRFANVPTPRYTMQLVAQNWGHVALILILLLGNLRALWLGGKRG